jgi:tetratricopeptide (TPR) repeat protein
MKIIPFKKREVDYKVEVRDNVKLEGIPFTWQSNLSDDQLREIYKQLLRDRFFVRRPDDIKFRTEQDSGIGVQFCINDLQEAQFEYEDGACHVLVFNEDVSVIYRTYEQWEAWDKAKEKEEEAKRRIEEREQALKNKHLELEENGNSLIKLGHLEEAEKCLLECRRIYLEHPDIIHHREAEWLLIRLYGQYDDPGKGLDFLSQYSTDSYHYFLLAERFSTTPHKAEAVFLEGIKNFPEEGFLYKRICLYLETQRLFDKAIHYCKEAISKGVTDDTKSGFPGRLKRLKKHKAQFIEQESGR